MTDMTQAPTPGPLSGFQKGDVVRQLDWNAITTVDDVSDQGAHVGVTLDGKYGVWPASRFAFIGRPDESGWMLWSGGENPVPGQMVDFDDGTVSLVNCLSDIFDVWDKPGRFRLAPTAPVEASGSERETDGDLLRATEALSAVVIADKHRPIGGVTSADWIRNVQKPAIDFAEKVLADIRPQLIRSERATEHHQGSGLRASVGDHEAQAHSELEPDDRTRPHVDQEGRRSREARRGDAVCTSGVERSECALGADEPQEMSVGAAVNAAALRPQPSGETREAVLRGALARIVERYPAMSRQLLPGEKEALFARPATVPTQDDDKLRIAAEEFCRRVEAGEIRSKRSYAAFKDALKSTAAQEGGE